jgi:hypothetical protein
MTAACPDCGEPEQRQVKDGKLLLNLDPVSGRCLPCLIKATPKQLRVMPEPVRDWQRAAANMDGDDDE